MEALKVHLFAAAWAAAGTQAQHLLLKLRVLHHFWARRFEKIAQDYPRLPKCIQVMLRCSADADKKFFNATARLIVVEARKADLEDFVGFAMGSETRHLQHAHSAAKAFEEESYTRMLEACWAGDNQAVSQQLRRAYLDALRDTLQQLFAELRMRRNADVIARVVDRHLGDIKARLWRPQGRLHQRQLAAAMDSS